jgi:hypothetical protein
MSEESDLVAGDNLFWQHVVKLVKDSIVTLERMEHRNKAEDKLLVSLKNLIRDYEGGK